MWLEKPDVTNFLFSYYNCDLRITGEESASPLHRFEGRKEGTLGREDAYILAHNVQTTALTSLDSLSLSLHQ